MTEKINGKSSEKINGKSSESITTELERLGISMADLLSIEKEGENGEEAEDYMEDDEGDIADEEFFKLEVVPIHKTDTGDVAGDGDDDEGLHQPEPYDAEVQHPLAPAVAA